MPRLTESRSARLPLPTKGSKFAFCSEVKGFGVRLTPNARTYIVQCRYRGEKLRLTLGAVGTLPFEGPPASPGAKDQAIAAINAARRGQDPRKAIGLLVKPAGVTLGNVWQSYEEAGYPKLKGVGKKRPSTIRADRLRYALHLDPEFSTTAIAEIDTARVRRWLDKIATTGQRSHSLVLLKSLLSFAESRGHGESPPIKVSPARSRTVQNYLTPAEIIRLDLALADLTALQPARTLQFSALRLLICTGARSGDILPLEWTSVDLDQQVLRLPRDKASDSGRNVLLTDEAVAIIAVLPRTSSRFVFPADSASGHITTLQKALREALERARLKRIRIHDLRHSFASASIRAGVNLHVVGQLLGHRDPATTAKYAHVSDDMARAALVRTSRTIGGS